MARGGKRPGAGRPKGGSNARTVEVKAALQQAFEGMGGVKALTEWGKGSPAEFYRLWAKLLPRQETEDALPDEYRAIIDAIADELVARALAAGGGGHPQYRDIEAAPQPPGIHLDSGRHDA